MNITYAGGSAITATGVYPSSEKFATKNFTVTGNNTTDSQMGYSVRIIVDENTFSYGSIKYKLTSTNTGGNGAVIPNITEMQEVASTGYSSFVGTGHFTKTSGDKVHTYALELYFPETGTNQNYDQGKTFKAHIGINDMACTDCLKDNIIAQEGGIATINAKSTPDFSKIAPLFIGYTEKTPVEYYMTFSYDVYIGDTYKTGPTGFEIENKTMEMGVGNMTSADIGKYICDYWEFEMENKCTVMYQILEVSGGNVTKSIKHEIDKPIFSPETNGIFKAEDDYGTSYYYRGAPENNYVVFAGMCWRVVRVIGDGSIKLALYNYNPNAVGNPCDSSQDGSTNAFARYIGETYTTVFDTNYYDAKYVGYMYGGAPGVTSISRAQATTNETSSTIKINLDTWYTSKLSSYASNIADTIYCNNRQLRSEVGGPATGTGFGLSETYYAGYQRLLTTKNPNLKCELKNDSFTVSDTTKGNGSLTNPIGLLTVDEVAYAGGVYANYNTDYYLYKNTSGMEWWSASPFYFDGGFSDVFDVSNIGYLGYNNVNVTGGLRPAVTLKSTTRITGLGTSVNPYKVV